MTGTPNSPIQRRHRAIAAWCALLVFAMVGAAYAAGEHDRLKDWALSLGWREVFGLMDFTWRGGLIRGKKLFEFMRSRFGLRDISALPMPYGAVATELASGCWTIESSTASLPLNR